ncbi:MAG: hypothetical protein ACU85V_03180 [Gammaproteobacteria bacterium]
MDIKPLRPTAPPAPTRRIESDEHPRDPAGQKRKRPGERRDDQAPPDEGSRNIDTYA